MFGCGFSPAPLISVNFFRARKLLAYFRETLLVIHLFSRLRGTKADPRRYEKWPGRGECHSGRRIILAFLKKKKTQGKFAFDEFNKSKAAAEEIFS